MKAAIKAGIAYWAFVFGLGFVLGTIRTLWLTPLLDSPTLSVLIELPFMLVASWFAASSLVGKFALSEQWERLLMGVLAFALLLLSEAYLGVILLGDSLTSWFQSLFVMPGLAGLTGQIVFALFPALVRRPAR